MRLAPHMLVLAAILLAGCAGHPSDCTLGVASSDCKPGTEAYEKMMQDKQDTRTEAEIDDARCRAYGAARGSADYIACRRKTDAGRKIGHPDR
jgi:hypothetical protein